ncbi:hypothetical protein QOZ88_05160 [Blastococcus sp. BMG 814]|uniref:Uncharacterized protein n=1 Tax=Blastococcus carthaginiensis TaxID=3050034 RepID=A0ABT9I8W7_9ACTN|nr:hypothetical protein [Blastococcus carthaginiensis]MDP5182018.1 hypothetical protein [Blastococcus carthaginiensis]
MDDRQFAAELERRLTLIEDEGSGEGPLPPLPVLDLVLAVGGVAVLTVGFTWWGYFS